MDMKGDSNLQSLSVTHIYNYLPVITYGDCLLATILERLLFSLEIVD